MSEVLDTTWKHQRRWSQAANRLKSSYEFWNRVVLGLAVAGAVLETLSTQFGDQILGKYLAGAGVVALALIPVFGQWKSSTENLRGWVGARSISEELKAQVYLYLSHCGDYSADDRENRLVEARKALLEGADPTHVAGIEDDDKLVPAVEPVEVDAAASYIEKRVVDQIRYFRKSASREKRKAGWYRGIQFTLAAAAALIGAVGALLDNASVTAWVAVLTTIGASVAAALAAGRHDHLVISYESNADRLESIRDGRNSLPDLCAFVDQCEAAFSAQNESWMSQFLNKPAK